MGSDTAAIGNLFNTGNLGQQKVYAVFSTRTPVTLYGKYGYFYAEDQDLSKVKPKYYPDYMRLYFKGILHQLYTLNGVSLVTETQPEGVGFEKYVAFTVREAQTVFDYYGNPYYFKPNDVGIIDWGSGMVQKILQGDDYFMPPIDGIHLTMDMNGGPTEAPPGIELCVSFTEEWTYLTGYGIIHAKDEDIVCITMANGGGSDGFNNYLFEVVFRGYDIGIYDLDAFCFFKERLYLSVRTPVLLAVPPYYVYAEDGDVICLQAFNLFPPAPQYYVEKIFKGVEGSVYDLDALHIWQKLPDPDL
jgi:hypothetical protein